VVQLLLLLEVLTVVYGPLGVETARKCSKHEPGGSLLERLSVASLPGVHKRHNMLLARCTYAARKTLSLGAALKLRWSRQAPMTCT